MRKFLLVAGLAGLMALGGGCDSKSDSSSGPVAVVDMKQLMEDTGQESIMGGKMQGLIQQLRTQINHMVVEESKKVKAAALASGKHLTDEQATQASLQSEAIQRANMSAQQQVTAMQQDLSAQFAAAVNPVINKVATDHGAMLVLAKPNQQILAYNSAIDLTEDVIKAIQDDKSIFADSSMPGGPPGAGPGEMPPATGPAGSPPADASQAPAPATQPTDSASPAAPAVK